MHALALLTAQLFPWTRPNDVYAKESGRVLNPQVSASVPTAVLNTSNSPSLSLPAQLRDSDSSVGLPPLSECRTPHMENHLSGMPSELFGEQAAGFMEKAVHMPQTQL